MTQESLQVVLLLYQNCIFGIAQYFYFFISHFATFTFPYFFRKSLDSLRSRNKNSKNEMHNHFHPWYLDACKKPDNKSKMIAAYPNSTIWRNKYLKIQAKYRSYKTAIRTTMMTYTAETRCDISKYGRIV